MRHSDRALQVLAVLPFAGCNQVLGIGDLPPQDASADAIEVSRECFKDAFGGTSIGTRWIVEDELSPIVIEERTGTLVMTLPMQPDLTNSIGSTKTYDLTNGYMEVELIVPPPPGTTAAFAFGFDLLYVVLINGDAMFHYVEGSVVRQSHALGTQKRFRMRHQGNDMIYETSVDGVAWQDTLAIAAPAPSRVVLSVAAGTFAQPQAGTVQWDNVKLKTQDCDPPP